MALDPKKPLDNLFGFATAYEAERALLNKWIKDGQGLAGEGDDSQNTLMQYFGETWGRKDEEESKPGDKDNMANFSYFKVLAVVSDMLQDKCRDYLKSEGARRQFSDPPVAIDADGNELTKDSPEEKARCLECIEWLRDTLMGDRSGATSVDTEASNVASKSEERNLYLKALDRMMAIENECFTEQIKFLEQALGK